MKRYICIKEYPHGPVLGKEIHDSWFGESRSLANYPDFWEELAEKDYEILSLIHDGEILDDPREIEAWEESLKVNWKPNSVKRLSDGVVFELGCTIKPRVDEFIDWTERRVVEMYIKNEILIMKLASQDDRNISLGTIMIKNANKISEAPEGFSNLVLTTNEGTRIYVGDSYYYIKPSDNWSIVHIDNANLDDDFSTDNAIDFATQEAAVYYRLLNKPSLSLKEVYSIIDNKKSFDSPIKEPLKELVLSKIL